MRVMWRGVGSSTVTVEYAMSNVESNANDGATRRLDEAIKTLETIIAEKGSHKGRRLTVRSSELPAITDALFERLDVKSAETVKKFLGKARLVTSTNRTIDARCTAGVYSPSIEPSGVPGLLDFSSAPVMDATPFNAAQSLAAKLLWIAVTAVDENGEIKEQVRVIDLLESGCYGLQTKKFLAKNGIQIKRADDPVEGGDPFAKRVLLPLDDSQERYLLASVTMPSAMLVELNESVARHHSQVAQRLSPAEGESLKVKSESTKPVRVGFSNLLVESVASKFQNVTPLVLLAGGVRHRPVFRFPFTDHRTRAQKNAQWQRQQAADGDIDFLGPVIAKQVRDYGGPARQAVAAMRATGEPVIANATMRTAAFDVGLVAAAECQQVLAPADELALMEAAKPDAALHQHQALAEQIGTLAAQAVARDLVMTDDSTDPVIGGLLADLTRGALAGLQGQTTEAAPRYGVGRVPDQSAERERLPTTLSIRFEADRVELGSNAPTLGLPSLTAIFSLTHCIDRHLAGKGYEVQSRAFRPIFRAIRSPQIDRQGGYGASLFMSAKPPYSVWMYLGDERVSARYRTGSPTTQLKVSSMADAIAPPFRSDVRGSVEMEVLVRYTEPTDDEALAKAVGDAVRRASLAGGYIRPESVRVRPITDKKIQRLRKGFGLRAETDFAPNAKPDEILDAVMESHTYIDKAFIKNAEGGSRYQNASRFGHPLGLIHAGYRLLDTTLSTARRDRQTFDASYAEPVWQTISAVRSGSDDAAWWKPAYNEAKRLWTVKPITQSHDSR